MTVEAPETRAAATARELRQFGLTVGVAFVTLAVLAYRRGHPRAAAVAGAVGTALIVGGLAAPGALRTVHRAWMALALAMSRVTTPIFMAVIYYAVLTPFGLAMRVVGRRPLARRRDAESFWIDRAPNARRSDLRRQF